MGMKMLIEIYFLLNKDNRTRHQVTLVKDQFKLDIRKFLFSQRTINEWNKYTDGKQREYF